MNKIVAVIGASADRQKFGNRAVRAFREQGYTVIPINPHEGEVEGLQTFRSVLDVPGPIDMASFYVPPQIGEQIIDEVAKKGHPRDLAEPGSRERRADRPSPRPRAGAHRRVFGRRYRAEPVRPLIDSRVSNA